VQVPTACKAAFASLSDASPSNPLYDNLFQACGIEAGWSQSDEQPSPSPSPESIVAEAASILTDQMAEISEALKQIG